MARGMTDREIARLLNNRGHSVGGRHSIRYVWRTFIFHCKMVALGLLLIAGGIVCAGLSQNIDNNQAPITSAGRK